MAVFTISASNLVPGSLTDSQDAEARRATVTGPDWTSGQCDGKPYGPSAADAHQAVCHAQL